MLAIEGIAELYLEEKTRRRRANTVYGYRNSIELHVLPAWGGLTIPEIDRDDVQDWVDGLAVEAGPGVAIETVAAMMGHSNVQTTYRYYYALTAAATKRAQRRVARSVLGKTCDDMYRGLDLTPPTELPMAA